MSKRTELKFNDLENETNINEIADDVFNGLEQNAFDTDVNTEITKKAHIVDANGELFPLED